MKKLIKTIVWVLGVVVVLLVGAAVVVPMVVDPNDYKDDIAAAVENATGRKLDIVGDIALSLFPRLAVDLGQVTLGNVPGFDDDYFARTDSVQVRVKLMPLLDKEVEMDTIEIDGLDINLARDASGRANWEGLVAEGEGDEEQGAGAAPAIALALGGVNLQNASLSWSDALSGQQLDVQQLDVQTGPVSLGAPLDVSITFDVEATEQQLDGHVEFAGQLAFDADKQIASGQDLTLNARLRSPQIPGGETDINFSGDAHFDQRTQAFSLSGFSLLLPGIELGETRGSLSIGGDIAGEPAAGRYTSDNLALEGTLSSADIPGNELPFKLVSGLGLDLSEQQLDLLGLQFTASELSGSGNLAVSQFFDVPQIAGDLNIAQFNPRALLQKLGQTPPDTADPQALSALELSASLSGSPASVTLAPFTLKLDDTVMKGNVSVATGGVLPTLDLELAVDSLDVDRYLAAGSDPAVANPGAAAPAAAGLPLETLRALDIDARLALGALKVSGLELEDIRVEVAAKDGLISLSPLQAKLYGGSYDGSLALDARSDVARIGLDEKLTGVRVGQLLNAVGADTGDIDLSDAAGDLSIKSNVSGDPQKQIYALASTVVEANVIGKALPGGQLVAQASADLNLDLSQQHVDGRNVRAAVVNLTLPGGISTTGTVAADSLQARLDAQQFGAGGFDLDLKKLELGPDAKNTPISLSANQMNVDLSADTVSAEAFKLNALGLAATGTVTAANIVEAPELAGQLDVGEFNLRTLLKRLGRPPIKTADKNALTRVSVSTRFNATPSSVALSGMQLRLDETKINGDVSITDLASPNGIRFNLQASALNADRYLPPQSNKQAGTPGAAAAALPLELLKGLDAAGTLSVKQLILSNLKLTNINVKLEGKGGVLNVSPASAELYGGSYAGNISVDARGDKGKLSVNERLKRVHIGPLLRDLNGNDKLSGRGAFAIKATAEGSTTDELKRTLTGNTSVSLKDGQFNGIDIPGLMCAGIGGLLAEQGGGNTRFSDLNATARIDNGVLRNEDLLASSPLLRVTGAGRYNIPKDAINYEVQAALVSSCAGQGGLTVAQVDSLPPAKVRITGSSSDPRYEVDLAAVKHALGGLLGIEELQGDGGDALKDLGLGGLGGILGGGQGLGQPVEQPAEEQKKKKQAEQEPSEQEVIEDILKGLLN